ncbi:hypothetical protein [Methylobacter sp. YRD-M1]|uniref:hypothetical protein n=1 Tax=Methylobacter sp. YRD-M1 TaxID=2911520 RepID=UPI00227D4D3A|nr:hypothetical protein [Methylobacter sp. YRD-M1]WAK01488.1 hypothetical protein LZ558_16915 [Methylobacter sp. YRD-M1]
MLTRLIAKLFMAVLFGLGMSGTVFAHAGEHHSQNCFIDVGDIRLRLSGYQFQPGLENEHFCRVFPELGQIIIAVEPLEEGLENRQIALELLELSSWTDWLLNAEKAFAVIKQQPAKAFGAGLISVEQTIRQRGVYALKVIMQDDSGHLRHQYFVFLVGIPVKKILAVLAGLVLLAMGFIWSRRIAVKSNRAT